jgi:hypothetical protein
VRREQGLRIALRTVYSSRFGAMPAELSAVVEATRDAAQLERWLARVATCSAEDLAAEVRAHGARAGVPQR